MSSLNALWPSRSAVSLRTGTVLIVWLACGPVASLAQDERFPLEPPDTTSPRASFDNLVDNVAEAYRVLVEAAEEYRATSELFKSDAVLEQQAHAEALLLRAVQSLDLSEVSPAIRASVSVELALLLAEVLARVPLPPEEAIPDRSRVEMDELTGWRVPRTGIDIVLVAEGPRAGEFLFSPRTVNEARAMYAKVKHLPYLSGEIDRFHERYISTPGRLLPPKWMYWVNALPEWSHAVYRGQPLWGWLALGPVIVVILLVPHFLSRWLRRRSAPQSDVRAALRRMPVPVIALLGLLLARYVIVEILNFTGHGLILVLKGLLVPTVVVAGYIAYLFAKLVAEGIIRSPHIDAASLDANMIRMVTNILGGSVAIAIVFYGASLLGVPVIPLVASLGVGGLAVALAARPTLENLIGGIILFTDRPVRVGDFCQFGDKIGTVEKIGVRSTQVRALDRTVITVPNAAFADMEIINWAHCDQMLIRTVIGLRYETRPDQLRYVLATLRELFVAHPKIDNDTIRIRFVGHGESSLNIEIRVYALTRDWNEFFAIQEDSLLRVGEIVEESGTGFAFPSRTLYLGRDAGLDAERSDTAAQRVRLWRSAGTLPFPNMAAAHRERVADTLDFPPRGSPGALEVQPGEREVAEPLSRDSQGNEPPPEDSPAR